MYFDTKINGRIENNGGQINMCYYPLHLPEWGFGKIDIKDTKVSNSKNISIQCI